MIAVIGRSSIVIFQGYLYNLLAIGKFISMMVNSRLSIDCPAHITDWMSISKFLLTDFFCGIPGLTDIACVLTMADDPIIFKTEFPSLL